MAVQICFRLRPTFISRSRKLILDSNYIEFDNNLAGDPFLKIEKDNILALRYGFRWIYGYQFVIGISFCIDIKTIDNQIVKIRLKTLYGINKKSLSKKYSKILNSLFDLYFDDISRKYINEISAGKEIEIAGVKINQNGVILKKFGLVPWEDLSTRAYQEYYLLNSKSNRNHHNSFYYLDDWNTGLLYSITRFILQERGFFAKLN